MPNLTLTTDNDYERAMADFFSRGSYLEPERQSDGRSWPGRQALYERMVRLEQGVSRSCRVGSKTDIAEQ